MRSIVKALFIVVKNHLDDDKTVAFVESLINETFISSGYHIGDIARATLVLLGKRSDQTSIAGYGADDVKRLVADNLGC